jgi:two-component system response regulator
MTVRPIDLLLVEDDANDEFLTCRALRKGAGLKEIVVVRDGIAALDYLFARGEYATRDALDLPNVVLLDLNLPRMGGLDVLKAVRADPRTHLLPVVIMTSSREDKDVQRGYALGANSYVVKPVQVEEFSERVKQLGLYWLANELPARSGGA